MFIYFQVLLLLLLSVVFVSFFKSKFAIFFIAFLLALFTTMQLVSINMGGALVDYKFYEHLHFDTVMAVSDFFLKEIIIFSVLFLLLIAGIYTLGRWLRSRKVPSWALGASLTVATLGMVLPNGVLANIYSIVDLKTASDKGFEQALTDLGIDSQAYSTSYDITATPGKNIIVLSLESLERGFLEPPLEHLTPNLRAFANKHTYLPMQQSDGSQWTTGSMYTVMTGMPAYFKSEGNEIFQNSSEYLGVNLGTILRAAGYSNSYLLGNKEFSGIEDMLTTLNFTVKSEKDFPTKYPKINWGLHDKDLFEEAKKEIAAHKENGERFAIFLSTISGHYPDGVYDGRMANVLPQQESQLEFMTSAVDYFINNLLDFLKEEDLLKDTAVFIFPDHTLMKQQSKVIDKFKNKRGLYFITNAKEEKVLEGVQHPVMQIDIPKMIVNGAGIETNATFLTDFVAGENKKSFLRKQKKNLLALNEASLKRTSLADGFALVKEGNKSLAIKSLDNNYQTTITGFSENIFYTLEFSDDMRLLRVDSILPNRKDNPLIASGYTEEELAKIFSVKETPRLVFSAKSDSLFGVFQSPSSIGITKANTDEISFQAEELAIPKKWNILQPGKDLDSTKIFLRSTAYGHNNSYGPSRIFTGWKPHEVTRGLNILHISDTKYSVSNFDTYGSEQDAKKFILAVESLMESGDDFYIIAHDSAEKYLDDHRGKIEDLGLPQLADLQKREAYIGYVVDGSVQEQTHEKSISVELDLERRVDPEIAKRKKDTLRFIAHAGGAVNNRTYTNSLEALNHSYKNGYRLFELDIIKTADDVFVAAHDWVHWSKQTGFQGVTPPTRQVFLENPIQKYTPLDIDRINDWFGKHPDAILVTDKTNLPKEFASQFIDPDRLMMELFSVGALREAKNMDMRGAIASETVIRKNRATIFETLRGLDVKYVALSRKIIVDELPLLKKLQDMGIKTYVYHVNFEEGRDENHVVKNEMDYVYGMYADYWTFLD